MDASSMFVGLPREEAFKKIVAHIRGKKYLLICRKREYDVISTTFPSCIEVRVGASWGAVGKLIIELIPSDEGSLIQTRFQPISGKVIAVGCGLIVFITAIFKIFLLPIVGICTSPIFLSWVDVYHAKDKLMNQLKQLLRSHASS